MSPLLTRRDLFRSVPGGIYGAALASLLQSDFARGEDTAPHADLKPRAPHFAGKAKAVIHLFQNGGPSQMDLFDPKPELDRLHGKSYADKLAGEIEFIGNAGAIMRSPFKFAKHGKCGAWVSDAMPHFTKAVDDVTFI